MKTTLDKNGAEKVSAVMEIAGQTLKDALVKTSFVCNIEEGSREKPRQTVVAAFWGKMAAHMLLLRLCSRQVDKRRAG